MEDPEKKAGPRSDRWNLFWMGIILTVFIGGLLILVPSARDPYPLALFLILLSASFSLIFSAWDHTRIGSFLVVLTSIPLVLVRVISPYFLAFFGAAITSVLCFGLSVILCNGIYNWVVGASPPLAALTFVGLISTSMIMTLWGNKVMTFVQRRMITKGQEHYAEYSAKLIGQDRIRVVLFMLYFVLLVIFSFCSYLDLNLTQAPNMDDAILKAFAAYIAFDRVVANKDILFAKKA